jgi:hypothetical protein
MLMTNTFHRQMFWAPVKRNYVYSTALHLLHHPTAPLQRLQDLIQPCLHGTFWDPVDSHLTS